VGRRSATVITLVGALLAVTLPIVTAIQLSRSQGLDAAESRALGYAKDVLRRSDATTDQIDLGIAQLVKSGAADPCSDDNIARMRQIDISSSYIQAVGYVSGNKFVCSSIAGREILELPFGAPDIVTPQGVTMRLNVEFPFSQGTKFIVVERGGYAVILDRDLALDATIDEPNTALAVLNTASEKVITSRGPINPSWLARLGTAFAVTFTDGGYVVAVARSQRWGSSAVAALPITYLDQRTRAFALVLVPIGLIAGAALAAAVLFLARQQFALPAMIRSAIRRDEFFLVYQPMVDLDTRRWVGAEALIRWRRPSGEMVWPDLFIPVAEESGLITQITERVVEIVAREAGPLFGAYPNFHVGINLASADLHSHRSVTLLRGLRQTLHAAPHALMVEATERGFLNPDIARDVVKEYRTEGVMVAIDDFGTGYSSLSYLHTFELDFLKIDKSFVDTIGTESATSQVVSHIIEMAKSLKLRVIAEGVETAAQEQFLHEHGVQYAQGLLYAKPMPMAELMKLLPEHAADDLRATPTA
jgi:sensor c-di-GMP phosphodiesterase-like protein